MIAAIKKKDPFAIVIVDFPLLFELGFNNDFDRVILAYVPRDVQLERVRKRDGLSKQEVERRLAAQLPIDEKAAKSDYVINNQGSLKETRHQVRQAMSELQGLSKKKVEGGRCC
jgi:dephospho-CoA kinase